MFSLGTLELFVIFFVTVVLLGPKRSLRIARTLGAILAKCRQDMERAGRYLSLDEEQDE